MGPDYRLPCSITISVDGTDTAFSPSASITQTAANTENLDICFFYTNDTTSGVGALIRVGCSSRPYTSSDDAVADGLSTE